MKINAVLEKPNEHLFKDVKGDINYFRVLETQDFIKKGDIIFKVQDTYHRYSQNDNGKWEVFRSTVINPYLSLKVEVLQPGTIITIEL